MEAEILSLKQQLAAQAQEITLLKGRLAAYEMAASVRAPAVGDAETLLAALPAEPTLSKEDVAKFSRQIILPEMRVRGQLCLKVRRYQFLQVHKPVLRIRTFFRIRVGLF